MRFIGLKTAMLAAGLMLAGAGQAAPQTAPAATTPTAAATPSTPAAAAKATPAPAATPSDPEMLALDGAPYAAPVKGVGDAVDGDIGVQPQVTPNGIEARHFHDAILLPTIIVISLFVLALLFWVAIRYRRAANPVASKTAHNTLIEIIWTVVPVIILAFLAIFSIRLLSHQFTPAPKGAITLKVTGNQWYWTYSYPENGEFEITSNLLKEKDEAADGERFRTDVDGPRLLAVDNRVVLPVGVPIRLITTSADVIHSWAVPAFWVKLDAVPGRLNETSFMIKEPGVYFGQCSELCGPKHGYMPIAVVAVPLETFNRWVVAKGGKVAGTPAPAAADAGNAAAPADDNASAPADSMIETDNAAAGNSTGQ